MATVVISKDEYNALKKFMYFSHITGNLNPSVNPFDKLVMSVVKALDNAGSDNIRQVVEIEVCDE